MTLSAEAGKPITLATYLARALPEAYLEFTAVGDSLCRCSSTCMRT